MSISMLTAPTKAPEASCKGVGNAMNGTRLPSGRSAMAWPPRTARRSFKVIAMGQASCGIGVPSGQNSRHEPHHRSTLSFGRRPHIVAAASLK